MKEAQPTRSEPDNDYEQMYWTSRRQYHALQAELEQVRRDLAWQPMETAPKTGEHILAARFTGDSVGFGWCGGKLQSLFSVVHWWDHPGEEGWYPSMGPDVAFYFTHWQPLLEFVESGLRGNDEI